jgi:hypothetical protein
MPARSNGAYGGDESNNEHPAKIEVNRKSRIEHSAAGESAIFRKWAIIETGGF